MTDRRFDILLTLVLLGVGSWYGVRMLLYPSNSGRVPAIVAGVMVVTLVVQLVLQLRAERRPAEPPVEPAVVPAGGPDAVAAGATNEPEPDSFDTLLALSGLRRRRLVIITSFSVLYLVGAYLVGFVITTAVLLTAVLLVSRERPVVALAGGALGAAASYGLVVLLLGLPAVSGVLLG